MRLIRADQNGEDHVGRACGSRWKKTLPRHREPREMGVPTPSAECPIVASHSVAARFFLVPMLRQSAIAPFWSITPTRTPCRTVSGRRSRPPESMAGTISAARVIAALGTWVERITEMPAALVCLA